MIPLAVALRRVHAADAALASLTAAERALLPPAATPKRRAEFAAGRAAARAALRRLLHQAAAGAEVLRDASGSARPVGLDRDGRLLGVQLSITHAGGLAAAAAAAAPVGIDLVVLERPERAFEEEAFAAGELAAWEAFAAANLRAVPGACLGFAAKEAALKWLGTGLELPLHAVRVEPAAPARRDWLGGTIAAVRFGLVVKAPGRSARLEGWAAASRRRVLVAAHDPDPE